MICKHPKNDCHMYLTYLARDYLIDIGTHKYLLCRLVFEHTRPPSLLKVSEATKSSLSFFGQTISVSRQKNAEKVNFNKLFNKLPP